MLQIKCQTATTKSSNVAFCYSEMLNKLFVKAQDKFPVHFMTESNVPPGSYIQAMLVYTRSVDCREVVDMCPTHLEREQGNQIMHLFK